MLVTLVQDSYDKSEKEELASAIDYICPPDSCHGWSSAGVYCFWDFQPKEVLYIGLAVDLAQRFQQHNGLLPCAPESCKKREIDNFFCNKDRLGFSALLQSSLDQPFCARSLAAQFGIPRSQAIEFPSQSGQDNIEYTEGLLIETCCQKLHCFPPWNKMSGSAIGREAANKDYFRIVKWLCGGSSFLVSKSTIREISQNPTLERYELFLHAIRFSISTGMSLEDALKLQESAGYTDIVHEIRRSGYLDKPAPFCQ
ncbi:MAG: hypothetical protein HJJLKODD_02624 [Phycisphaerae bacterium]|nr:hypothetical protein [Phycisphaerae bacterium]